MPTERWPRWPDGRFRTGRHISPPNDFCYHQEDNYRYQYDPDAIADQRKDERLDDE